MWLIISQSANELIQSAKRHHSLGILLVQASVIIVSLIFFYGAYSTIKQGFKLTNTKTLTGPGAYAVAAILALIGAAIVVFAIFFLPGISF